MAIPQPLLGEHPGPGRRRARREASPPSTVQIVARRSSGRRRRRLRQLEDLADRGGHARCGDVRHVPRGVSGRGRPQGHVTHDGEHLVYAAAVGFCSEKHREGGQTK